MTTSVSLVIASFDEGPDLEATVALARASDPAPSEIIVVDDWSQEPVEARLAGWRDVRVVRPPERLGAGPAKAYGAQQARGDLIVLMDAHLRFAQDWLRIALEAHSRYPLSILCGVSTGFDQAQTFTGAGARFVRRGDVGLDLDWLGPREATLVDLVPAVLGGCYFIPRTVWSVLGGMNPNLDGWGYEEQDLSLRAWMNGYDCRCINGLRIAHNYRRTNFTEGRNEKATWHALYNGLVVAATVFEDGVFEERFRPFVKFLKPNHAKAALRMLDERRDQIRAFREDVQAKRLFNDAELMALVGYQLPDMHSVLRCKDLDKERDDQVQKHQQQEREEIAQRDAEIHARIGRDCPTCSDRPHPDDPSRLPGV